MSPSADQLRIQLAIDRSALDHMMATRKLGRIERAMAWGLRGIYLILHRLVSDQED